jgi:hypothetical protein
MGTDKIALLAVWAVAMGIWSMNVWGGWAEQFYERQQHRSTPWYWLRTFGVPTSRENCIRFIKGVSLAGMVLSTLGMAIGLGFGK